MLCFVIESKKQTIFKMKELETVYPGFNFSAFVVAFYLTNMKTDMFHKGIESKELRGPTPG